nr:helix-turn-helix domain-containing protein [Veillonella denticariosi]
MEEKQFNCPVEASLSVVGGKYKSIILFHLMTEGTLRFNEIQKLIPQATIKMLSQQLKDLEGEGGVIHKEIYPVVPPKTEYSMTEFGETLRPIIMAMCDWGGRTYKQDMIK